MSNPVSESGSGSPMLNIVRAARRRDLHRRIRRASAEFVRAVRIRAKNRRVAIDADLQLPT